MAGTGFLITKPSTAALDSVQTIGVDIGDVDSGGTAIRVFLLADGESFSPASVDLTDAMGQGPTYAEAGWTAPSQPGTVTFSFLTWPDSFWIATGGDYPDVYDLVHQGGGYYIGSGLSYGLAAELYHDGPNGPWRLLIDQWIWESYAPVPLSAWDWIGGDAFNWLDSTSPTQSIGFTYSTGPEVLVAEAPQGNHNSSMFLVYA